MKTSAGKMRETRTD